MKNPKEMERFKDTLKMQLLREQEDLLANVARVEYEG